MKIKLYTHITLIFGFGIITACGKAPLASSTDLAPTLSASTDTPIQSIITPTPDSLDQEPFNLVNQIGGISKALVVEGAYAYLGVGPRLMVIDLADISGPQISGQSEILSGVVQRIVVRESYTFVLTEDGLAIIDVSNPRLPQVVSTLPLPAANDMFLQESYAYITRGEPCVINSPEHECDGGLWVVDVSDPAQPILVSFVNTSGEARGVFVEGNFAYIADGDGAHAAGGLRVVDISNPQSPVLKGSFTTNNASFVVVDGSHAYVAGDGFWILDVSEPTNPIEMSAMDTSENFTDLAVAGNYAYLVKDASEHGVCSKSLWIVDIQDPAAPIPITSIPTENVIGEAINGKGIQVANNLAYLVVDSGFEILDVTDDNRPAVGHLATVGAVHRMAFFDDYLYLIAGGACGGVLKSIDILDLNNPEFATECVECGGAHRIEIKDGQAYFATSGDGLKIFRIGGTDQPALLGQLILGEEGARGIYDFTFVGEDYIALSMELFMLRIVDVENPAEPTEVAALTLNGLGSAQAAATGNYLYVPLVSCKESECASALQIIDIADPSNPFLVNIIELIGINQSAAVSGKHLFLSISSCNSESSSSPCLEELLVFGLDDPARPNEVGSLNVPDRITRILAQASYIYLLGESSLTIVDIADPASPREVGLYLFSEQTLDLVVAGDNVFIANKDNGLWILQTNLLP